MATILKPLDHFANFRTATLIFVAFATVSYAESQPSAAAPLPPTNVTVTISVGETAPAASAEAAPVGWTDIKDYTSERRDQFLAGLQRLEDRVNAQINELTAKRAVLKTTANAKDLDEALHELSNAQFAMKTLENLLSRATPQTWEQTKAKIGLVWIKSQEVYAKIQTLTTS